MRIGELATRSGVTTKTLRYYEQAGVLAPPARSPSGYRQYDGTALPRLAFVRAAQACGFTLAEICQIIAIREHSGPPCTHVAGLLDAHAAQLEVRIAELTALRRELAYLRSRADLLQDNDCSADTVCHVIPTR
jgi:MerR family copper efflux transcriptional regulator